MVALATEGKAHSARLAKVWADQGYQGNRQARQLQTEFAIELELVARPTDPTCRSTLPKRWIVERTFAWLGRYRRLSKDYEFHRQTTAAWIYVAMSALMLRRLVQLGGS
jgi:putative transposase